MPIVKKYVIAVDSAVPSFNGKEIRMFLFAKDTICETVQEAEKYIEEYANGRNQQDFYTILPVYIKE